MKNARQLKNKQKRQNTKKIIRTIILTILIIIILYTVYGFYKESKIKIVDSVNNIINNQILESNSIEGKKNKLEEKIDSKFKGYNVDARLEVPKIKLKTNVLSEYSTDGLDLCISKYYGPNPNEIGNFCIAGHNYNKSNMFNHLIDLEIGDKMYLSDNTNGKLQYSVYDIYRVKPENVEPLSQKTNGKREITLITCVNYSRNRLIIKAIES